MLELDVREFLGHFQRLVHIAKRAGKDQLAALLCQIAQHRDCACILGHVLDIDRLDLVAQGSIHRLTALVMRPGPAKVADGAQEDKADLDLVLRECGCAHQGGTGNSARPLDQRPS